MQGARRRGPKRRPGRPSAEPSAETAAETAAETVRGINATRPAETGKPLVRRSEGPERHLIRREKGPGKRLIRKEKSPGKRTAACRMLPRNGFRHFPARKVSGYEETSYICRLKTKRKTKTKIF